MGSDRARVSYNPKQQYRSVVMQQGRVTLEADFNEELAIAGEELHKETLDIVGPSGTPDNGYLVAPLTSPPFDIFVGPGTMYVGGLRVTTPPEVPPPAPTAGTANAGGVIGSGNKFPFGPGIRYTQQADWLDHSDDPDWVEISPNNPPTNEFVYLFLREQEVSAVEDSDLKDVALGGPDTAQRTRLLQHIIRLNDGKDCASGLDAAQKKWNKEGLTFNPPNMRLESAAKLKVQFSPAGPPPDLCNPQAQSGYLGADNQLIRVQISATDSGKLKFVWGFDDASFLYRLDLDPNNKQLLHLQSRPVDAAHQPQSKQAVEALRTAAELSNGEYIASLSGLVFTLDQDYNPDTQMISLPASLTKLPDEFYNSTQTPRVFLRVWEEEVSFTPGTAVDLGNTGLQVTLQAPGNVFHLGDYWLFAVRPSTPQQIYPERYLADFQPPDGPRMWVCPLGVITWNGRQGNLTADCRNPFDNLVELTKRKTGLGGCCTVSISPESLKGNTTLQSVVDSLVTPALVLTAADAGSPGNDIFFGVESVIADPDPMKAKLSVALLDQHTYTGLTLANIQATLAASTGLVHVVGAVTAGLAPQAVFLTLQGGAANKKATAAITNVQNGTAFTLEAKKAGASGNNTSVVISNVNAATATFDLTVRYIAIVNSITLAELAKNSNENLAYDVTISPPDSGFAIPIVGITHLSGGTDGSAPVRAKATIFAQQQNKVCLAPGIYSLPKTLELGVQHSGLSLESCGGDAVLQASAGAETNFLHGLMLLNAASNITLHGLTLNLPAVPFVKAGGTLAGLNATALNQVDGPEIENLIVSVGLRPLACTNLMVDDCTFNFQVLIQESGIFEAGILASGINIGFVLENSQFVHKGPERVVSDHSFGIRIGYLLTPSVTITAPGSAPGGAAVIGTNLRLAIDSSLRASIAGSPAPGAVTGVAPVAGNTVITTNPAANISATPAPGNVNTVDALAIGNRGGINGAVVESALVNASFHDNQFLGLTAAAVSYAITTAVQVENNTVSDCYSGFWVLSLRSIPLAQESKAPQFLALGLVGDPVVFIGSALGRAYPLPSSFQVKGSPVQNAPAPPPPPSDLTSDQLRRYFRLQFGLAALEKVAFSGANSALLLNASLNNIQAIQLIQTAFRTTDLSSGFGAPRSDQSSCGFVVWCGPEESDSEVVLSANTVHNNDKNFITFPVDRPPGLPTVALVAVARAAVTGNQVINQSVQGGNSLVLDAAPTQLATPPVAITGNVLRRQALYPVRAGFTPPLNPPFNSWDFMNTMIP
jgi:Family of unknown function (DUF6519)